MTPGAGLISVSQTLDLLDGTFLPVAMGVAEDRYAFWLGSGISRRRVPLLAEIVEKVLEHLRSKIAPGVADCRYKAALEKSLGAELADLSPTELAQSEFDKPVSSWPIAEVLKRRLSGKYSLFLSVDVGRESDHLLWDVIDVRSTYANPATAPDVEHLCVAILVLEGVASSIATANWDGLIEKAALELSGAQPCVVCVDAEDLKQLERRAWLYKFHGCAIRARDDEAKYRSQLVARQAQIDSWVNDNKALANELIGIIGSKPTLMLGLSAQDGNIRSLFVAAREQNPWTWPGARPSFVVSENTVGALQEVLIDNIYRSAVTPATKQQILNGAKIGAYASQLLTALVLHILGSKICRLVELAAGILPVLERNKLKAGVVAMRNLLAAEADLDRLAFIRNFVDRSARAKSLFRDGHDLTMPRHYDPLTDVPVHKIENITGLLASGLTEAAVALAILGIGVKDDNWSVSDSDSGSPTAGMLVVKTKTTSANVVFVNNSHTGALLQNNDYIVEGDETVVIHSSEIVPSFQRSPVDKIGRDGKVGTREVSIRELLEDAANVEELFQNFRAKVTL